MQFDDVFHQVGNFGKYQMVLLIWLSFLMGWPGNHFSNIYYLMELPFTCSMSASDEAYSKAIFMNKHNVTGAMHSPKGDSQCYRYIGNKTEACSRWEFDHSEYGRTAVEKFELVCSRAWLKSFANTMVVLGMLVGAVLLGQVSDRFGRMRTVVCSGFALAVFWTISFLAPYYPLYAIARLLAAASWIGSLSAGYVYILEMVAPSKRLLVAQLYNSGFNVGYMLLSGLAYAVKDGIYVEILCVAPYTFLLLFSFFAPESARWLFVNDQHEKAAKVLNKMKRINNKSSIEPIKVHQITVETFEQTGTLVDVFKSKVLLKRTLILITYWMSVNLLYYALVYNSAALIPGNFYINNFLLAAVGLPATVIGLVLCGWKRTGRRLTCSLMMILPGVIGFISIPCTIYKLGNVVRILSILGKLFVGVAFDVIYLFTAESFPTEVRSSAFGVCSTCGRVGSIFATFVGRELASLWLPLPYVVFGLFGTISGSLILLLPETLNKKLSETIQEVEEQCQMVGSVKDEKIVAI